MYSIIRYIIIKHVLVKESLIFQVQNNDINLNKNALLSTNQASWAKLKLGNFWDTIEG